MCIRDRDRLSEASVALKSIREKGGHPVPLSDRLGAGTTQMSGMDWDARGHRELVRQTASTDPHVQVGGGRCFFSLLDHRGKSLEAESTFPDRRVQVFSLRGAKVFGAAAEFRSKDGVDFFTFPEGPRGENTDVCASGVQTLCHDKIDRLGRRFLDGKSADGDQKFLLHEV